MLERVDLQILHALQIWPRVSWASLGPILSIDPITAARRWARLESSGIAWMASYKLLDQGEVEAGNSAHAVIELQVRPKHVESVLTQLQRIDHLMIVRSTLGEWNVSFDWHGSSLRHLEHFIRHEVADMKGVQASRSFPITRVPIEGSTWRYEALSFEQERAVQQLFVEDVYDPAPPAGRWHSLDDTIMGLVQEDVRMSYTEMAKRANCTVTTAKRHLTHLIRHRDMHLRCDLSRQHSKKPVTVRFFATVPATDFSEVFHRLGEFYEVRSCSVLLGKYNLMINVWLESIYEASTFEARLAERTPTLMIWERDLVTRYYRQGGKQIGEDGRTLVGA